ncbi:MAG: hypothetical protein M3140_07470, partial [Actinomycetota bacterium]|nr:hypothetical protein [Actinomycetota bacterium]
ASAEKNQLRWQFGILGPPQAADGVGEPPEMSTDSLLLADDAATLSIAVRFLQLQSRTVERRGAPNSVGSDEFEPVPQLQAGPQTWVSWDEAVPHELVLGPFSVTELIDGALVGLPVPGGRDVEVLSDPTGAQIGRLVRERRVLEADVSARLSAVDPGEPTEPGGERLYRLSITVANRFPEATAGRDAALARSFLGAHLLLHSTSGRFLSLLEPPESARAAAQSCRNVRCWPVLASDADDVLLVSPIILYDHPAVAPQSAGALFDATEIDEILTLRVMTMTDAEKAEARATDPHAAAIIERCDAMSPEALQRLHGVLRDPHLDAAREAFDVPTLPTLPARSMEPGGSADPTVPTWADTGGAPWWDPAVDASVCPERDTVRVGDVAISRGSRVRVHPRRRADAQDLFFAEQDATVAAVYADVDGNDHVAVVLTDDPAADLHEWYGRYLYFAPDELEPLSGAPDQREE